MIFFPQLESWDWAACHLKWNSAHLETGLWDRLTHTSWGQEMSHVSICWAILPLLQNGHSCWELQRSPIGKEIFFYHLFASVDKMQRKLSWLPETSGLNPQVKLSWLQTVSIHAYSISSRWNFGTSLSSNAECTGKRKRNFILNFFLFFSENQVIKPSTKEGALFPYSTGFRRLECAVWKCVLPKAINMLPIFIPSSSPIL